MVDRTIHEDVVPPRPLRVLVVDDERLARERLIALLRAAGDVDVVGQASNGVDALREVARWRPEVVFLDVQMPGMDGLQVMRALAEPRPEVVLATAHPEANLDVAECLLKPFARAQVAEVLGRLRVRLLQRARRVVV